MGRNEIEMETRTGKNRWIVSGITVSLIVSILFIASYQIFFKRSQTISDTVMPYESSENINWIYQSSYMLYKELYQKVHHEEISYEELFYPAKDSENNFWENITDEPNTTEEECISYAKTQLDSYFSNMEQLFYQLNICYDYMMEDLESGEIIGNLSNKDIIPSEQYFYLEFLFDHNGNVTVGNDILGKDVVSIRKNASAVIHENTLNNLLQMKLNYESYTALMTQYCITNPPKDCRLVFCISKDSMAQFAKEGVYYYYNADAEGGEIDTIYYANYDWSSFVDAGIGILFTILFFLVFFLPLIAPKMLGTHKDAFLLWNENKILRIPFEILLLMLAIVGAVGEALIILAYQISNGGLSEAIHTYLGPSPAASDILSYLLDFILVWLYFMVVWILGIAFCEIRYLGPKQYFMDRSVIMKGVTKGFPIFKEEAVRFYDTVAHFDVTKEAKNLILKIVLVNAVILFVICSLGMGGLSVAIVYSLFLYLVLRKYISNLQNKYGILLKSINKMAEGDLDVEIQEDLGVFEPFKPQLIRIRDGFQKAVDEEVKSQQMKAELITNVSHDLKTPLTAIITYVNLLKDDNITEDQRKEYLLTLERKSLRLKSLIEDLFEVSKANSNTMTLQIMDVDIFNLLKQVVFELSDKIEQAHLDVRIDFPEEKVILPLDSQKTFRIYENLVNNIAKYALPGTRVYIEGRVTDNGEVIITLKNISAQEIHMEPNLLTERFVRGDSSRNTEGSGLGLAIAKSFTKLQGGELSLELDGDLFKATTKWNIK